MPRALLLELGTEDLPARYLAPLAGALARGIADGLTRRDVAFRAQHNFATPRRIAVLFDDVAEDQPEQTIERLGPSLAAAFKDGQPTPAALGFAKSCGVAFGELGQKDGKLHFAKVAPGRATRELLAEIFEETLRQMDELVPKRMRWGSGDETFVRPVQWIACLFGGDIVPLQRFGLTAGRITYGHRFHAPAAITLATPADYVEALRKAHVWADVATRKAEIRRQIEAEAARLNGYARISDDLLDEVASLVEWPVAITGSFEQRFLELPPEVIVATVETNQRYFTVFEDAALKTLTRHFITVSNIESRDVAQVITGNERVVRPRLTDALFFWQQDLKQPLAAYGEKLETVTFQKDLGSTAAKVARIARLAGDIAVLLDADKAAVERAATLCKNDLVTKMVYEFPELQGLMGGYYARKGGESEAVATAIAEHYLPTQQGTPIPSTVEGRIVALADKLDTLAGIFAIGQKPTASKDPYALRRAALGVLRIIREANLKLHWYNLVVDAVRLQPVSEPQDKDRAQIQLRYFIWERYRNLCVGSRLSKDSPVVTSEQFDAVESRERDAVAGVLAIGDDTQAQAFDEARIGDIEDFEKRLSAVQTFAALPEAASLTIASKRARNILRQAPNQAPFPIDSSLFEAAEHELWDQLVRVENALEPFRVARNYTGMLIELAALKAPVDVFFESVLVMAEDPGVRSNRLGLLARLDKLCGEVADLSLLPG